MKRILLIEDDWPAAMALTVRLNSAGYDVMTAPGASVGRAFAKAHHPDLIITDIFMPSTDGLTLVSELRKEGFGEVPFIVITASQRDGIWEKAISLGAAAYFEKPYEGNRLLNAVAASLNQTNSPRTYTNL
jgi:DNA-binding response OmpR family regulator